MKKLKMLALGSVLLGLTSITQGSVLLGFNSFDSSSSTDSVPDEKTGSWSGGVTSDLADEGGSIDDHYGKDWDQPGIGHLIYGDPPTTNNGYVDNGNITLFFGRAGSVASIDALLFDAVSTSASGATFEVTWSAWTDDSKTTPIVNGSGNSGPLTLAAGNTQKADSDYQDFAINLGSFTLPVGGYFEINWNSLSGQSSFKIDNIALVPEPGSMLGLGCLVGIGTLLRSRRRTAPVLSV